MSFRRLLQRVTSPGGQRRREVMHCPSLIGAVSLTAILLMSTAGVRAQDLSKYPDWSYQWYRVGPIGQYNPTAPRDKQGAPLTPEYQAIYEAGLKDVAAGGQ